MPVFTYTVVIALGLHQSLLPVSMLGKDACYCRPDCDGRAEFVFERDAVNLEGQDLMIDSDERQ